MNPICVKIERYRQGFIDRVIQTDIVDKSEAIIKYEIKFAEDALRIVLWVNQNVYLAERLANVVEDIEGLINKLTIGYVLELDLKYF
jgi:hypothetical protein